MLNRQKIVLLLLEASGGSLSRTSLVKLLFLLFMETPSRGGNAFYEFLPYHHGPYSFLLFREVGQLVRSGLIEEYGGRPWRLTDAGRSHRPRIDSAIERDVSMLLGTYGGLSSQVLTATVYERYPRYTILSEKPESRLLQRPVAAPAVYTVGYEGRQVDGFMDRLLEVGVQRIVDVRNNPWSRRWGFHGSTLSWISSLLEIDYQARPQLGIPSADRSNVATIDDYEALFEHYVQRILPRQSDVIQSLASSITEKPSVLVCKEADPAFCHRSHLASILASRTNLPVVHL